MKGQILILRKLSSAEHERVSRFLAANGQPTVLPRGPSEFGMIAKLAGSLVGYMTLQRSGVLLVITSILVDKPFRRLGIATGMLRLLPASEAASGVQQIAFRRRSGAEEMFLQAGFAANAKSLISNSCHEHQEAYP